MMNEIKITTELCAEDRKRIDTLTEAMGYLAGQIHLLLNGPTYEGKQPDPIADLPEEVKPVEAPAETAPWEEHPVENPFPEVPAEPLAYEPYEPKAPTYTKDDIRKLVVTLSANGKKAEARDIVLAHGTSITDLPEESINTVFKALKALEG
jgi:hypothetical protein